MNPLIKFLFVLNTLHSIIFISGRSVSSVLKQGSKPASYSKTEELFKKFCRVGPHPMASDPEPKTRFARLKWKAFKTINRFADWHARVFKPIDDFNKRTGLKKWILRWQKFANLVPDAIYIKTKRAYLTLKTYQNNKKLLLSLKDAFKQESVRALHKRGD